MAVAITRATPVWKRILVSCTNGSLARTGAWADCVACFLDIQYTVGLSGPIPNTYYRYGRFLLQQLIILTLLEALVVALRLSPTPRHQPIRMVRLYPQEADITRLTPFRARTIPRLAQLHSWPEDHPSRLHYLVWRTRTDHS